MNMKRRNGDAAKLRRPLKRVKIVDGMYESSTLTYLKMVLLWSTVLICDFLFELRFEYFWPFWMFARSAYDSFRYQGLAFSLFFVLMTITSDMICYIFIPVHWLFFAASTYVWVQYVWHAERGICLPTLSLWILFIYIEASLRLKDEKHLFFHADFSRPFAAHCVGFPAISLGVSFKGYAGHRFRLRRQTLVMHQNDLIVRLLQQALPPDMTLEGSPERRVIFEKLEETISNGSVHDASPKSDRNPADDILASKCKLHNASTSGDIDLIEQQRRLEMDVKRLRADLNSSRQIEQELRSQVSNLVIQERNARNQLQLLQLDNDSLQIKLHNLVTGRQQDKQAVVTLEKKVTDEKKLRQAAESQLQQEKKKVSAVTEQAPKCTEQCKARRRELEAETRQLRRDNRQYEDRVRTVERELQGLHDVKDTPGDADVLMSALSAMQEKNRHLEKNLSSETRLKMDLVAALGDAKRELEISKSYLTNKEREICELNAKLADVLSVMPTLSSPANVSASGEHNGYGNGAEPYLGVNADLYDLKMTAEPPSKSQLDPNAAAYTPKMA